MKKSLLSKKYIITIIISFIVVVFISYCLNKGLFIKEVEKQPTREELNIIYANVIDRNSIMLENPIEYGDKYCSGYVSTANDKEHHIEILNELEQLSDEICVGKENDYDKIKAIAYYVAENIYYNKVAAEESVTADTICLETVLDTKTTTCAGYSNLFSALCNMQDIYCVNLRGGTFSKDFYSSENLMNAPINHEWNAVLIEGEWLFIDTTWLSNNKYTEDGYHRSDSFNDMYLEMSLEEMSYEHRIDIIDYRNFKSSINAFD